MIHLISANWKLWLIKMFIYIQLTNNVSNSLEDFQISIGFEYLCLLCWNLGYRREMNVLLEWVAHLFQFNRLWLQIKDHTVPTLNKNLLFFAPCNVIWLYNINQWNAHPKLIFLFLFLIFYVFCMFWTQGFVFRKMVLYSYGMLHFTCWN